MIAVHPELLQTIKELQKLPSLHRFAIGGGTNLAIRYNHRVSTDIDLFCPDIVGIEGYARIENDIREFYAGDCQFIGYPNDQHDQFMFLRAQVVKPNIFIKIEIFQNFKRLYETEIIEEINLLSEIDIGLLKLIAVSNRAAYKDAYDLEYITEKYPLEDLYKLLQEKEKKYNTDLDKTFFDLDGEVSPTIEPLRLLSFDQPKEGKKNRPGHSSDRIEVVPGNKAWLVARSGFKRKVRSLFREIGVELPAIKSQNSG